MSPEKMLREFHKTLNVHDGWMPDSPTVNLPKGVRGSRLDLLIEEVNELIEAMLDRDIVKIADGIADIAYVVAGTAVVYGIPFDEVFTEVHRSNMTKTNVLGTPKLVKGPDYEPPRIAEILEGKKL